MSTTKMRAVANLIDEHNLPYALVSDYSAGDISVQIRTVRDLLAWVEALDSQSVRAYWIHGTKWLKTIAADVEVYGEVGNIPGMVVPPKGWTFSPRMLEIAARTEGVKS